jgi:DNA repair protein RecO (recombination protein O)
MTRTYKATGINLKAQALGETDKLVTILTQEVGLIRVVAPGARKHKSSLGGRSGTFVVNELLIAQGRSLDRIIQAQTIKTYPSLAKDLGKLAASQYLAEIVLYQALSEQPQRELYEVVNEHLQRLDTLPNTKAISVVAYLVHGIFHLLALAGLTPQVQVCCLTQRPLAPNFTDPHWQVGFSIPAGGIVSLEAWANPKFNPQSSVISSRLNAIELGMLQHLSQPEIMQIDAATDDSWLSVEQILRQYIQYYFGRPIRSATLIDSYFAPNHDAIV